MKVIDLLNKIANGEEIPEKFKFAGQTFEKQGSYIEDADGDSIFDSMLTDFSNINDEVEIIEEDKKIRKLPNEVQEPKKFEEVVYIAEDLARKINEIIDKLNEMEKE